jgi:hypothetical protein
MAPTLGIKSPIKLGSGRLNENKSTQDAPALPTSRVVESTATIEKVSCAKDAEINDKVKVILSSVFFIGILYMAKVTNKIIRFLIR